MPRLSVTFTENNDSWLSSQASNGDFSSKSDVVNDLIRRERDRLLKREWLAREIQKGLDSGVANYQTKEELLAEIRDSVLTARV